jgi:hypothetical protein
LRNIFCLIGLFLFVVLIDVFHYDPEYEENEKSYDEIKKEILGDQEEEAEEGKEGGEGQDGEAAIPAGGQVLDGTLDISEQLIYVLDEDGRFGWLTVVFLFVPDDREQDADPGQNRCGCHWAETTDLPDYHVFCRLRRGAFVPCLYDGLSPFHMVSLVVCSVLTSC